ncbi:GIY-YIG nuclease family protein [Bacillus mycoides]
MINIPIPQNDFCVDLSEKQYDQHLEKWHGIYMFYNKDDVLLYVGRSQDIKSRIKLHMDKALSNPLRAYNHNFHYVSGFYVEDELDVVLYKIYVINNRKPKLNLGFWCKKSIKLGHTDIINLKKA